MYLFMPISGSGFGLVNQIYNQFLHQKSFSAVKMSAQFVNFVCPDYAVSMARLLTDLKLHHNTQFVSK